MSVGFNPQSPQFLQNLDTNNNREITFQELKDADVNEDGHLSMAELGVEEGSPNNLTEQHLASVVSMQYAEAASQEKDPGFDPQQVMFRLQSGDELPSVLDGPPGTPQEPLPPSPEPMPIPLPDLEDIDIPDEDVQETPEPEVLESPQPLDTRPGLRISSEGASAILERLRGGQPEESGLHTALRQTIENMMEEQLSHASEGSLFEGNEELWRQLNDDPAFNQRMDELLQEFATPTPEFTPEDYMRLLDPSNPPAVDFGSLFPDGTPPTDDDIQSIEEMVEEFAGEFEEIHQHTDELESRILDLAERSDELQEQIERVEERLQADPGFEVDQFDFPVPPVEMPAYPTLPDNFPFTFEQIEEALRPEDGFFEIPLQGFPPVIVQELDQAGNSITFVNASSPHRLETMSLEDFIEAMDQYALR